MDNRASIPARFKAESKPSEGLVRIEDTMTGREGTIRLRCYQSVASLLSDLFPGDEAAEAPAAKAAPATAAPVAQEPAQQPKPEKSPETTASGMDVIDTGGDDEDEDPKSLAEKVFGGLFGEPDDPPLPPETPKAKRKPGRPKKAAAEKVAEQPASEEPKAKKKPGRPKKAAAEKPAEPVVDQTPAAVEEPKAKKKPGRPKKSTTTKAAEAIAEEAPASKPARAKKAPKKAAPKKTAASAKKSPSGAKEVIEEPNYKLVLDGEASEPTYTIYKNDGSMFGRVQLQGKEAHLIPEPADRFKKTKHKSLMGAQSRIDVLIEVEDEEL